MMGLLRNDGNAAVRCTGAASFAANIGARISVGSLGCCCFCIALFHYSKGASAFIRIFIKSSSNAFFPILFPFSVSVPISCFRFLFCGVRGGLRIMGVLVLFVFSCTCLYYPQSSPPS